MHNERFRILGKGRLYRVLFFFLTAGLLTLFSCSQDRDFNGAGKDVLTQKVTEDGRTQITVLVKYAFSVNNFERILEEKYPDIDIIQVGNYTKDSGIDEYARRMEHDDLTDIVMTWPLEVGEEYWTDRLVDLSGYDFTSRYNLSDLNEIARDRALYYIPGPAQVRGIVYNKTLFEEKGWEVPGCYEEFVALCKTIDASGIRALQLGFKNPEVLDTAFMGYNYGSCFSKPEDLQWIAQYEKGIGSFGDHFGGAIDVFQEMIDAGIFRASDLEVDYSDREWLLFTRQCAMVEDSALLAKLVGEQIFGTEDEFALMPFFDANEDNDWARIYRVCYIGVNKHLEEPKNKNKLDLVMKIMEYISTPEGQKALASDTEVMFSSLQGMEPPDLTEIQYLVPALSHGRYAVFQGLENVQKTLREGLSGLLRGEISKEDVIQMVDNAKLSPVVNLPSASMGTATENFTLLETGNFVTDVMREWGTSEIALFLDNGKDGKYNGKGISGCFYEGDVTDKDIACVLPDLKSGDSGYLRKITMKGKDIIKTLEYSVETENNLTGWFYYFSGLSMEYNPTAEAGKRIKKIRMSDGTELDEERVYTLVIMDGSVPDTYILDSKKTEITVESVLKQAIQEKGTISPSRDGRFVIVR